MIQDLKNLKPIIIIYNMEKSNKYHAGKIILGMDNTSKSYIPTNGTNAYYNKLRIAHKDI